VMMTRPTTSCLHERLQRARSVNDRSGPASLITLD
jgi:hypothetical protein